MWCVVGDLSSVVHAMLSSVVGVPTFWTWLHYSKGGARIDSGRLDAIVDGVYPDNVSAPIQVHPKGSSKPDLYCTMLEGLSNRSTVAVSPYPAAWRVQIVDDETYKGFEYIR